MAKTQADELLDWIAQQTQDRSNPDATVFRIFSQMFGVASQTMTARIIQATNLRVQSGPFEGMQYIPAAAGSSLSPKLVGCYEAELHKLIESFPKRGYQRVINVGCGEGYYAVGLARMLPQVGVFAFDLNPQAQQLCRQLAQVNGVAQRVQVGGNCSAAELTQLITPQTLLFCDIEGAERQLLDPAAIPALKKCDLVVEMHDFLDPGISNLIFQRFATTHATTLIPQGGRDPYAFPALKTLSQFDQFLITKEDRPGLTPWAFLAARR